MLAKLLRGVLFAIASAAVFAGTAAWYRGWDWTAVLAVVLFAPLMLPAVLGVEFLLLGRWGADPDLPAPTGGSLARAWLVEAGASARAFGWRQAFAAESQPDVPPQLGRRGVVLVHGYVCNRGIWATWLKRLRTAQVPTIAVTLEPVFGSIDRLTAAVDEAVARLQLQTGLAPLVVAHSMGGLVVRAWLRDRVADQRVEGVVTIGSPHAGTWLARFSRTPNGRQMRRGSAWLAELAAAESTERRARFTCFYSDCDNIVFPAGTARLAGADNRLIAGVPHIALVEHPDIFAEASRRLHDRSAAAPTAVS